MRGAPSAVDACDVTLAPPKLTLFSVTCSAVAGHRQQRDRDEGPGAAGVRPCRRTADLRVAQQGLAVPQGAHRPAKQMYFVCCMMQHTQISGSSSRFRLGLCAAAQDTVSHDNFKMHFPSCCRCALLCACRSDTSDTRCT